MKRPRPYFTSVLSQAPQAHELESLLHNRNIVRVWMGILAIVVNVCVKKYQWKSYKDVLRFQEVSFLPLFSLYLTIYYTLAIRGNKELSRQLAEEKRRTQTRCSRPEAAKNAKKTP